MKLLDFIVLITIGVLMFVALSGCEAGLNQNQEVKGELIIRYPEMARCFDLYEEYRLDAAQFQQCIETTSSYELTLDSDGVITEIIGEGNTPLPTN